MFNLKLIELILILQIWGLGNVICVLYLIFSVNSRNQHVRANLINVSHSRESLCSISHQGQWRRRGLYHNLVYHLLRLYNSYLVVCLQILKGLKTIASVTFLNSSDLFGSNTMHTGCLWCSRNP